jgi:hypothetical protein
MWRPLAPDQGSTVDLFLFTRLKSIMKGARFSDMAAIQEHVTAVLRSSPKEAFDDSFQKLFERCQQYGMSHKNLMILKTIRFL